MARALRAREVDFPGPEEELGISHECPGWQNCALCHSTRLGVETLRRAQQRRVEWRENNPPLSNPVRKPVAFTTLDDAFDAMLQFMTITSRKCRTLKHHIRYHSADFKPSCNDHSVHTSPPARVMVNTLPGNYTVTAARWGSNNPTTRVVTLDPNKSITVTMTV